MVKNYFIGNKVVFDFLQTCCDQSLIHYSFAPWSIPYDLFSADNVIFQLETYDSPELYHNIKYSLPTYILLRSENVDTGMSNVILMGLFPYDYYKSKFRLPESYYEYYQLPLNATIHFEEKKQLINDYNSFLRNNKEFFGKDGVNIESNISHIIKEYKNWFSSDSDLQQFRDSLKKLSIL